MVVFRRYKFLELVREREILTEVGGGRGELVVSRRYNTRLLVRSAGCNVLKVSGAAPTNDENSTGLRRHLGHRRLLRPRVRPMVEWPAQGLSAGPSKAGGV